MPRPTGIQRPVACGDPSNLGASWRAPKHSSAWAAWPNENPVRRWMPSAARLVGERASGMVGPGTRCEWSSTLDLLVFVGRTLRQIGAELGLTATTVSDQLRRAGVTMRSVGTPAHPGSTQQILELRDQGLTWSEVARQVDMTVSGTWSRYRRTRPPKSTRLGRWQQVLIDALDQNLAIGVRAAVADHLGRVPTRAELTAARRAAHSLAALGRARVLHVPGADADANAGDRNYLVLAKPNVIMNDIRLRGLAVGGTWASWHFRPNARFQPPRSLLGTTVSARQHAY